MRQLWRNGRLRVNLYYIKAFIIPFLIRQRDRQTLTVKVYFCLTRDLSHKLRCQIKPIDIFDEFSFERDDILFFLNLYRDRHPLSSEKNF